MIASILQTYVCYILIGFQICTYFLCRTFVFFANNWRPTVHVRPTTCESLVSNVQSYYARRLPVSNCEKNLGFFSLFAISLSISIGFFALEHSLALNHWHLQYYAVSKGRCHPTESKILLLIPVCGTVTEKNSIPMVPRLPVDVRVLSHCGPPNIYGEAPVNYLTAVLSSRLYLRDN